MRIIAGQFRGRNLKSPPSIETRPTSDRLRETLFNVLAPRIHEARFLDLCAGSGAVGIEALSRGAERATFVDRSADMCGLIAANLEICRVADDRANVVSSIAVKFLRRAVKRQDPAWNLIYFDPPYADDYLSVLRELGGSASQLLAPAGLLIVEHFYKRELPPEMGTLALRRILKQGDSVLSFYERQQD